MKSALRIALGSPWIARFAAILECSVTQAKVVANGKSGTKRRRLLMLERYLRQKRGAMSSRRARGREALERQLQRENASIDALIAWCESELAKKK